MSNSVKKYLFVAIFFVIITVIVFIYFIFMTGVIRNFTAHTGTTHRILTNYTAGNLCHLNDIISCIWNRLAAQHNPATFAFHLPRINGIHIYLTKIM